MARTRPIVLLLDDLHAADAPSLLLLRFAHARRCATADNRNLARQRPDGERELRRNHRRAGARRLLRRAPGRARAGGGGATDAGHRTHRLEGLVDAIHDRTDGHPFFVAELVRLLASEGRLDALPHGVQGSVARRVGLLSEDCRRVLVAASVVGREFASDVLARVDDAEPETIMDSSRRRSKRGAEKPCWRSRPLPVRARARPRRLYDELSTDHRIHLHRRVAEALEAIHAPELDRYYAEVAHHFFLAAAPALPSGGGYAARGRARGGRAGIRGRGAPLRDGRDGTRAPARRGRVGPMRAAARPRRRPGEHQRHDLGEGRVRERPASRAAPACPSSWRAPRSATAAA